MLCEKKKKRKKLFISAYVETIRQNKIPQSKTIKNVLSKLEINEKI